LMIMLLVCVSVIIGASLTNDDISSLLPMVTAGSGYRLMCSCARPRVLEPAIFL